MTDWTTTPPTEEGWYWHHTPDRNELESQDYKVVHVELERDKIGVWLFGSWDEFVTLESMGGLWHPEKLQVPPLKGEEMTEAQPDFTIEWFEATLPPDINTDQSTWYHYIIERNTVMTEPDVVHFDLWQCLAAIWRGIWKRK